MACKICSHEKREQIEHDLMLSDYGNSGTTLKDIAKEHNVPLADLQVHALMHTSLSSVESDSTGEAISFTIRQRDADKLSLAAEEYFVTLKTAGADIRKHIHDNESPRIPRQLVDLYIGAGANLRQTMESMVNMNLKLNGEQDSGVKALTDLVSAIRQSK